MKTINNFIIEHLEYSTFPINEKLKISSKSKTYNYFPKDKFELREILEKRLKKDKNANLNDIDVSQITDMGFKRFKDDKGLFEDLDPHDIDISEWDVSNVTDMQFMFLNCHNLKANLSRWDVSNVINMNFMFFACRSFNSDLGKWNVSKVEDMEAMFEFCKHFTGEGLENWNVSNVKNMQNAFMFCIKLTKIPDWYKK